MAAEILLLALTIDMVLLMSVEGAFFADFARLYPCNPSARYAFHSVAEALEYDLGPLEHIRQFLVIEDSRQPFRRS